MSLLKKVVGKVGGALGGIVGGLVGGPVGASIGGTIGGVLQRSPAPPPPIVRTLAPMTPMRPTMQPALSLLPALPGAGPIVAAGVGMATRAARSAIIWCRRNPQWCSTIGGTAAVAAMIERGELPHPPRRRSRGITGRELRAFRRVHGVLSKFCAPKMKIRRKGASKCL